MRDWYVSAKKYDAIDLGPYQEQIREYLLGKAAFFRNAALTVILSKLRQAAIAFNFPDTVRVGACHSQTISESSRLPFWSGPQPTAWCIV